MSLIKERISDHVLRVKINRPEARNAIDFEIMEELEKLVGEVEADEHIRVLILTGVGNKSFVAGGDLKKFHTIKSKTKAVEMSTRMHQVFNRIEQLHCWTVAFINGDAYGGGIELMLSFDFRISVPSANYGFTQGRFYLVPGWGGLTRLVEKVGRAKTLEWCGKSAIISAESALSQGLIEHILVNQETNSQNEVLEWVEKLTNNDRKFIRTLKEGAARYSPQKKAALKAEIKPFAELWVDEQHVHRVQGFMDRKK